MLEHWYTRNHTQWYTHNHTQWYTHNHTHWYTHNHTQWYKQLLYIKNIFNGVTGKKGKHQTAFFGPWRLPVWIPWGRFSSSSIVMIFCSSVSFRNHFFRNQMNNVAFYFAPILCRRSRSISIRCDQLNWNNLSRVGCINLPNGSKIISVWIINFTQPSIC